MEKIVKIIRDHGCQMFIEKYTHYDPTLIGKKEFGGGCMIRLRCRNMKKCDGCKMKGILGIID